MFQINTELYRLFGTKQIVISHASGSVHPSESTPSTVKAFLSKYCAEHPNTWDEHLPALSFAFNVTLSEPTKNTPFFQMFNRNPCVPEECPHEAGGENTSVFARIVAAVREADAVLENKTPSAGQVIRSTRKVLWSPTKEELYLKSQHVDMFMYVDMIYP